MAGLVEASVVFGPARSLGTSPPFKMLKGLSTLGHLSTLNTYFPPRRSFPTVAV